MKVPGKGKRYLNNLGQQIKKQGLKWPIVLAVSKLTGRAYIHDGNHHMAVLKSKNVEWVPVKKFTFLSMTITIKDLNISREL